jgi:hypothetical protein
MDIELINNPPTGPLIYCFRIGADVYVGKASGGPTRPLNDYRRNVQRLLAGKPYRAGKPDKWRLVHRVMADAVRSGVSIRLEFHASSLERINDDEQRLIRELGATLNGPAGARKPCQLGQLPQVRRTEPIEALVNAAVEVLGEELRSQVFTLVAKANAQTAEPHLAGLSSPEDHQALLAALAKLAQRAKKAEEKLAKVKAVINT